MRVLIAEDAPDLADAMATALGRAGHAVDVVGNGLDAVERLRSAAPDLLVLDVALPGTDGFAVLAAARNRPERLPVLVVTARSNIDDKVSLLDLGADDHLAKPFDLREFEARVRALLRRPLGLKASAVTHGNLVFDGAARSVTVAGAPVRLGRREFRLLEVLLGRIGAVVGKERLVEHLFASDEDVSPNAVELYVSRLRRKLGPHASVEIATARGEGYALRLRRAP